MKCNGHDVLPPTPSHLVFGKSNDADLISATRIGEPSAETNETHLPLTRFKNLFQFRRETDERTSTRLRQNFEMWNDLSHSCSQFFLCRLKNCFDFKSGSDYTSANCGRIPAGIYASSNPCPPCVSLMPLLITTCSPIEIEWCVKGKRENDENNNKLPANVSSADTFFEYLFHFEKREESETTLVVG